VDVQITREDYELGSYPVISVVWDDYSTEDPEDYIAKCICAFDLPEESIKRAARGPACFTIFRMGTRFIRQRIA
jgi:hypothetical protein